MRLAIVDDDPLMRDNLSALFSEDRGIRVVGTYGDADEALRSLSRISPEIMLVDLGLPGGSSLELIRQAKCDLPGLDIMVHALFEDPEKLLSAIRAGASGYILKGAGRQDLVDAVRGLHTGRAMMGPQVAQRLIREIDQRGEGISALDGRQRTIVHLTAEGRTCREIADRSGLSLHDVGVCFKSIYVKAQIRSWQ